MEKKSFPWGRTFLIGFGFLGISVVWPIFNQWVPLILQAGNPEFNKQLLAQGKELPAIIGFGLAPGLAMFIMTWDNIVNIFVQPWVGTKSDRTWNRLGRRKSWILMGLPIALAGFISIPLAQTVLAVAIFVMITNFGMALFRSPVIAWLGDLFKPEERSKANGVINLMGGIGGVLAFVGGGIIFKAFGRSGPFVAGAVALTVAMIVVILFVKEKKSDVVESDSSTSVKGFLPNLKVVFAKKDKSGIFILLSILFWFIGFNALDTSLSSFAVFTLGMKAGTASIIAAVANLSFIAFAIPSGMLAGKLGRRKTIIFGLLGMAPVFILSYFFVNSELTFIIALVLTGFFWAWVNVNSLPLVYDHGDEAHIGAYTGMYYFSSQLAAVLGPTMGGFLVENLGFDYRVIFIFSALFILLACLTMLPVKDVAHEKKLLLEKESQKL